MWETVTIKADMVKSYSLTKQTNIQKLQLELLLPACDILHFCPSEQKSATISFGSNIGIETALASSLGEEKYMPSQVMSYFYSVQTLRMNWKSSFRN